MSELRDKEFKLAVLNFFKELTETSKEHHENDVSANWEYQQRDRNYKKRSNRNSKVEKYKSWKE